MGTRRARRTPEEQQVGAWVQALVRGHAGVAVAARLAGQGERFAWVEARVRHWGSWSRMLACEVATAGQGEPRAQRRQVKEREARERMRAWIKAVQAVGESRQVGVRVNWVEKLPEMCMKVFGGREAFCKPTKHARLRPLSAVQYRAVKSALWTKTYRIERTVDRIVAGEGQEGQAQPRRYGYADVTLWTLWGVLCGGGRCAGGGGAEGVLLGQ